MTYDTCNDYKKKLLQQRNRQTFELISNFYSLLALKYLWRTSHARLALDYFMPALLNSCLHYFMSALLHVCTTSCLHAPTLLLSLLLTLRPVSFFLNLRQITIFNPEIYTILCILLGCSYSCWDEIIPLQVLGNRSTQNIFEKQIIAG